MNLQLDPKQVIGAGSLIYLVSGRIPGDDDDTAYMVLADDDDEAREIFSTRLQVDSCLSEEDVADLKAVHDSACFIITCDRVGQVAPDLAKRLREIAEGARSKADVLASRSPTATYVDPVQVLRALANEAERGLAPDPDKGLEIQRMLMVSTRHLPEEHRDWLLYQSRCLPAMPDMSLSSELDRSISTPGPYLIVDPIGDYGYRVCVDSEAAAQFLDNHNMEDPLVVLIRFAQTHRCDWLAIDRDGPVVDGLATYED